MASTEYLSVSELLVRDPSNLILPMNFWSTFMESERKHVECVFGILKARFRILKLPIRMHKFDDMFIVLYSPQHVFGCGWWK